MTWLDHILGLDDGSGHWYLFWSGFGANFQELALLGGIIAVWRQHNCHTHRCWRLGKHKVDGTPWTVCRKHHPEAYTKPTVDDIRADHTAAKAQQ